MTTITCTHADQIKEIKPASDSCLECAKEGTKPVALRACLSCGHVGCCDSSIGLHARKHFEQTGHVLIQSVEAGGAESWRYCYEDKAYL